MRNTNLGAITKIPLDINNYSTWFAYRNTCLRNRIVFAELVEFPLHTHQTDRCFVYPIEEHPFDWMPAGLRVLPLRMSRVGKRVESWKPSASLVERVNEKMRQQFIGIKEKTKRPTKLKWEMKKNGITYLPVFKATITDLISDHFFWKVLFDLLHKCHPAERRTLDINS